MFLAGHGVTAPLLTEMLHNIQTEIQRYERLVNYWPVHAPLLEEAVCTVLRAVTVSITRQCGLLPAKKELMHASSYNRGLAGYVIQACGMRASGHLMLTGGDAILQGAVYS